MCVAKIILSGAVAVYPRKPGQSGDEKGGGDTPAFAHQNVVGATGGRRIHGLEADVRHAQGLGDARMGKMQPAAGAEQQHLDIQPRQEGEIRLWDYKNGKRVRMLEGGAPLAVSPNGQLLAYVRSDGRVQRWSFVNEHEIGSLVGSPDLNIPLRACRRYSSSE